MALRVWVVLAALSASAAAQTGVSFRTADGGLIYGDIYGRGSNAVVLAHGGRFDRESWKKQANVLAQAGFLVLAIDYRGEGKSHGGTAGPTPDAGGAYDLLGAVHYLREQGVGFVSVVGASMGGDYAAEAAKREPAAIDRLLLLAAGAYTPLIRMKGGKLFILARDDANAEGLRLPKIRAQFDRASEPKEMVILDGSAHAQFLFQTSQGERVMREIVRFASGM